MRRLILLLLAASLCIPVLAQAGPGKGKKRSVEEFYREASGTIATVEFIQEFLANGQKQQTRGYTDGVVITKEGLVLISGRVRFPQRGGSGRISRGSRPELSGSELASLQSGLGFQMMAKAMVRTSQVLPLGPGIQEESIWELHQVHTLSMSRF